MSDKKDDFVKNLEEQIRDMLGKANLSFVVDQKPRGTASDATPSSPDVEDEEVIDRLQPIREFNLKPRDIRDYLDRYIIRQDEGKKVLSVAICDHYNHVRRCIDNPKLESEEHIKHNVMFVGPTGVGKTYMMRCAARLIGVPFVKADATKFTETGYVGHDVEDLVRDLVKAADGDVELAQYGIIFLDEIDKIAAQSTVSKDVSGRGVQINLLKLMEETDVSLFSQTDLIGQMQAVMNMQQGKGGGSRTISTKHILFIVSGAFDRLAEDVKKRISASQIGFAGRSVEDLEESKFLRQATTKDFMTYGFEPEFVGRLPVRVVFDALSADDLEQIMVNSEGNVLQQYSHDFEGYGIEFHMDNDAIREIAERAHEEKTGARGLMTVLERLFRDYKYELPSTAIRNFDITKRAIQEREAALAEILEQKDSAKCDALRDDVKRFSNDFHEQHGIKLTFSKDALEAVIDQCLEDDRTVRGFAERHLKDLEYAIKLITRNSGKSSFSITRRLIENPADELARRVADSFKAARIGGDGV